jgi:RNA polymerase sigma factor (sigma-70 family)
MNHVNKIIYDDEICKEITQECFLRIFSKSITLDPDSPATRSLLISSAKNIAIDYLRRKNMESERFKEKYYMEYPSDSDRRFNQPMENTIFEDEINGIVTSSMDKFHAKQRYVFHEVIVKGKAFAHVSKKSSMSRYKVKKYYDEVVGRLREDLAEYR